MKRLNIYNFFLGTTIIFISIILFFFNIFFVLGLMLLLSFNFILAGVARIINSFLDKKLDKISLIAKILTGSIAILIGLVALLLTLFFPTISIDILLILFKFVLFLFGANSILIGYYSEVYTNLFKKLLILIGVITLSFSIIMIFIPILGYYLLVYLISLTLLINGILRVTQAFVDYE